MRNLIYKTMGVICLCVVTIIPSINFPEKRMEIIVKDVGQGDSIVIYNDVGEMLIIDGGPTAEVVGTTFLRLPFLNCKVFGVLVTHPDYDHIFGLNRTLELCDTKFTYFNDVSFHKSQTFSHFKELAQNSSEIVELVRGDKINFGEFTLYILWPTESFLPRVTKTNINEMSISLLLDYKNFEMLFTGDINKGTQRQLNIEEYEHIIDDGIDVYKVPHHGSEYSFDRGFLLSLQPKVAVISSGEGNSYGHPSALFIDFFEEQNIPLYRTDTHGSISIKLK